MPQPKACDRCKLPHACESYTSEAKGADNEAAKCLVCNRSAEAHQIPDRCLDAITKTMDHLLRQIATPGACKSCKAQILWVTHQNGKHTPYDSTGLNHFVTCPMAERHSTR